MTTHQFKNLDPGSTTLRRNRAIALATHVESLESRRLFTAVFSTLAAFGSAPQGILPESTLSVDGSGNLYGDATSGGASDDGTVFEITHGSGAITTLASFDGVNGKTPEGSVIIDAGGDLFGTTNVGGANGDGTAFEVANGANVVTTLASFNGTDGSNPDTGLILDSAGDLFGTTTAGGAAGDGTVFEVVHGSNAITRLASFSGANGSNPSGSLAIDSSGNLYGATSAGGIDSDGVVFELPKGGGTISALASFNGTNGQAPAGGVVIDGAGNLYGVGFSGGANNVGDVFELVKGASTITALASFNSTNGEYPHTSLTIDSTGNLFGAASSGGADGDGDAFQVVKNSGAITVLSSFDFTDGALPEAGPILSSGNLFGTTDEGGADGVGAVYEVAQGSNAITAIASFSQAASGPAGGLTLDSSGNLFGTTGGGDSEDSGAVFEIASGSNTIDTLASFNGTDGSRPNGGVIEDSSGDLFGTTGGGGLDNDGAVFEIVQGSGVITTLASFTGANGKDPQASSLVLDISGNLYGTTASGGTHDDGSVFEIVKGSKAITTIASFDGSDGANPFDGVILDNQGNLFGTAESGGAGDLGDVFEIVKSSGIITALASFNGANGEGPSSGLAIDSSGNLYGTTQFGGANNNNGTVFEVVNGSKAITTLASFDASNGRQPEGSVTLDAAGNLYGATQFGGADDSGTVFEVIKGSGEISIVYSFTASTDGANPQGGVALDGAGNIFGSASSGGAFGGGTVFDLAIGLSSNPATQFAFVTKPDFFMTAGNTFSTSIVVDAVNQFGDIDPNYDSDVTLNMKVLPAGSPIYTPITVTAVNGVATFSSIPPLDLAGGYKLKATQTGMGPGKSTKFFVEPAAASQFVFAGQPNNVTAGDGFASQIVVHAEDPFGNLDTNYDAGVTLGLKVIPTGAPIFSAMGATAVSGVATFTVSPFDFAGGYKFKATESGLSPGKSFKFFILPAAASQLAFFPEPSNGSAGLALSPAVSVDVEDQFGNLVSTDHSEVTIEIESGPGGAILSGVTMVAAGAGEASFNDLLLDTAGDYTLKASDDNVSVAVAVSAQFAVAP